MAKPPDHHEIEEVFRYMRDIRRSGGMYGTMLLMWRGQEIVHVKCERGFQPGELPPPLLGD